MDKDEKQKFIDRLSMAETTLTLLAEGKMPATKKYLDNSSLQYNVITDSEKFWRDGYKEGEFAELIASCEKTCLVRVEPGSYSKCHIFVEPGSQEGLKNYDATTKAFMAVVQSLIGFDMRGLGKLPWQEDQKSGRKGE